MEKRQSTDVDTIEIDDWNVDGTTGVTPKFKWALSVSSKTSHNKSEMTSEIRRRKSFHSRAFPWNRIYRRPSAKSRLFCSSRLVISVVSCLGFVTMYILLFNLQVAMAWMVNKSAVDELKRLKPEDLKNITTDQLSTCIPHVAPVIPKSGKDKKSKVLRSDRSDVEFVWTDDIANNIVSSFSWGYILTLIPGGWLADRYGGKWFFAFPVMASSLLNILIPWAAWTDNRLVMFVRYFMGVAQGVAWPAIFVILSRWTPPKDRHKLTALAYSGAFLGLVITFPAVAILCDEFDDTLGWPYVFYLAGIVGILMTIAWIFFVFDSPEEHPRISTAEKQYICKGLGRSMNYFMKHHPPTPWKKIMTSVPFWAMVAVYVGDDFTVNILIDGLSTYITNVYGSDRKETAFLNAVPYVGFILTIITSGFLYDLATFKYRYSSNVVRKVGNTIGTLIPGILILVTSFMGCDNKLASMVLIIACISIGGVQYGAGYVNNAMDLAPQHIGVLIAIANQLSALVGITTPIVKKLFVTNEQSISQWHSLFKMLSVVLFLNAAIFNVFGSTKNQKWDRTPMNEISFTFGSSKTSTQLT